MATFWAVYFGATLALISIFLVEEVYKDYRRKKLANQFSLMLDKLEDLEADDEDDEE